jgi:hypothetical protein
MRDFARALAVSMLGYLVASIFLHSGYPRFLWMVLAASFALADVALERQLRRSPARLRPIRPIVVPHAIDLPRPARIWAHTGVVGGIVVLSILGSVLALNKSGVAVLPARAGGVEPVLVAVAEPTETPTSIQPETPAIGLTPTPLPEDHLLALTLATVPQLQQEGCAWFGETQHNTCGLFTEFWNTNGGLEVFGYPLTERFEIDGRTVQYFERARFEIVVGDDEEDVVRLADLGSSSMLARIGVDQSPPTVPLDDEDCVFEDVTGHNTCGRFAYYWVTYGGADIFGYPISEELEEEGVVMQYFEKARFEYRPDFNPERFDVVLARVGAEEIERMLNP